MLDRAELEMELTKKAKEVWGELSTEFLVGAISSITTETQLKALIDNVRFKSFIENKELNRIRG